jgi:hypothetical protein
VNSDVDLLPMRGHMFHSVDEMVNARHRHRREVIMMV